MTVPRAAIVVTTIFDPAFLRGYLDNLSHFGREDTALFVIPDRKTPPTVADACAEARRAGFDVRCPDLGAQEQFLRGLGVAPEWIPYDTDNRRNVGYLMALATGAPAVVSIDDDNFCPDGVDFVGAHAVVGSEVDADVRDSPDGYLNVCAELGFAGATVPHPRGYPYAARTLSSPPSSSRALVRVAVNAGLWTDDPDVDAVTRLAARPRAVSWSGNAFVLGPRTWSPVNTQNTALSRAAMHAYYYIRMGFPVGGMKIDRYGDILSGYFVQACARHLGETVRIGDPVCRHVRTPHDLFKDLYHELAGMVIVEALVPWLRETRLSGSTYADAYASLVDGLREAAPRFGGFVWDQGGREFLVETATQMETWLKAVRVLG